MHEIIFLLQTPSRQIKHFRDRPKSCRQLLAKARHPTFVMGTVRRKDFSARRPIYRLLFIYLLTVSFNTHQTATTSQHATVSYVALRRMRKSQTQVTSNRRSEQELNLPPMDRKSILSHDNPAAATDGKANNYNLLSFVAPHPSSDLNSATCRTGGVHCLGDERANDRRFNVGRRVVDAGTDPALIVKSTPTGNGRKMIRAVIRTRREFN
jgi:hypothetical protein